MAHLRRHWKRLVGIAHVLDFTLHIRRKGRGLLGCHVDVHDDVLSYAGGPIIPGMKHLLHIVNALGIMVEELGGDSHGVARMQFAEVGDMGFKRKE